MSLAIRAGDTETRGATVTGTTGGAFRHGFDQRSDA